MKYFIIMNLIMVTMYTFNSFEAIMIMTGGGPLYATEVLSLHMYHTAFDYGLLGQGSALAVILFLVNLAFTVFYVRKFRIQPERFVVNVRRWIRLHWRTVVSYLFLIVYALFIIAPLYWLLTGAFKPETEIVSYPPTIIPKSVTLEHVRGF